MRRPRLTDLSARARLTLLYTALVAICGGVLVTATYLLVANNLRVANTVEVHTSAPANFMQKCTATTTATATEDVKHRCLSIYDQAVHASAIAQRASTLSHLLLYSLLTLAAVAVLAAIAAWILAGRILRPIRQLTAAARNASEHSLSQRLALGGPRDELRQLADTFDDMLERLDQAFQGQRRFIANASHELRTPLTMMRTTLDVVLAKPAATNAELVAMGNDVRRSVQSAEHLINALLTLARNERGLTISEPVDLAALAEDVLEYAVPAGIAVRPSLHSAPLLGDATLLERLVGNLVDNAIRYNQPAGTVEVHTGEQHGLPFLRIVNTGPLIPIDLVESLFHPFTRLDDRTGHDGFGLGLALVQSIASVHNANVAATSNPGGGLDITIWFVAAELGRAGLIVPAST